MAPLVPSRLPQHLIQALTRWLDYKAPLTLALGEETSASTTTTLSRDTCSVGECVDDSDVRFHLDGLAVEDGGAIAPFANRAQSGTDQHRLSRDDFQ